jgi:hypothetical protein
VLEVEVEVETGAEVETKGEVSSVHSSPYAAMACASGMCDNANRES